MEYRETFREVKFKQDGPCARAALGTNTLEIIYDDKANIVTFAIHTDIGLASISIDGCQFGSSVRKVLRNHMYEEAEAPMDRGACKDG